jgi:hypothetical protein
VGRGGEILDFGLKTEATAKAAEAAKGEVERFWILDFRFWIEREEG